MKLPELKKNCQNIVEEAASKLTEAKKPVVEVKYTVKQAVINVKTEETRLDITSSISVKNESPSYMIINFETTSKVRSYREYSQEDLQLREQSILALLEYWKGYKQLKDIDRLFFRMNNETLDFIHSTDNAGLTEVPPIKNLFSNIYMSNGSSKLFRENQPDNKLAHMLLLTEEVNQLQEDNPTFSSQKKHRNTLFALLDTTFYYQNKYFNLKVEKDDVVVMNNDDKQEMTRFSIEPGVMQKVLDRVEEETKLYNLLHPPIVNFKFVINEYFLLKFKNKEDDRLEDMIREFNAILANEDAESEFVEMKTILEGARREGNKHLRPTEVIRKFVIPEEELPVFNEHFNKEFTIYKIKTEKNYWFFMYSNVKSDSWVFVSQEDKLPAEAEQTAFSAVEERLDKDLMAEVDAILQKLQNIKGKCKSTKLDYPISNSHKSILEAANSQFGLKWREKIETTK
ncbi:hypothetical protein [Bacillus thuringiensis]|uniref:hypothetical protein n=1 Tax=Bacillus thuringiensis TaxID=1428 RepID=UPI0021D68B5E|nr:hypothetical protein [Bacillus thuringiensis]MCU7667498.1 hypothetical protein [Bacillus thuringiensis]